jgi:hypothetical protein
MLDAARLALSGEPIAEETQPSVTIGRVRLAAPQKKPTAPTVATETMGANLLPGGLDFSQLPPIIDYSQSLGPAFVDPKSVTIAPGATTPIKPEPMGLVAADQPTGFLRKAFGYIAPAKPPGWEYASPIEKFTLATHPISHVLTRIGGKMATELGLTKKEDVTKVLEGELAENVAWYQKSPEAVGWTAEKIAEYETLSGLFKLTGLHHVLSAAGRKLAYPFMARELATPAGSQALKTLSTAGLKNLAQRTMTSFLKAAPENAGFVGSWSALDALKQGKSGKEIGSAAITGAATGAVLTAGFSAVTNAATTPEVKTAMQRALSYLNRKYPRMIDLLGREVEPEFIEATMGELNRQRGTDVRFVDLDKRGQAAIRNVARVVKAEVQKAAQKEAQIKAYWTAGAKPPTPTPAAERAIVTGAPAARPTPEAVKPPIVTPPLAGPPVTKPENIYLRMPIEQVRSDARNGVSLAREAWHIREPDLAEKELGRVVEPRPAAPAIPAGPLAPSEVQALIDKGIKTIEYVNSPEYASVSKEDKLAMMAKVDPIWKGLPDLTPEAVREHISRLTPPVPETEPPVKKQVWQIINSRGQQLGKTTYPSREAAQKALEKRITSPIARTQFAVEPVPEAAKTAEPAFSDLERFGVGEVVKISDKPSTAHLGDAAGKTGKITEIQRLRGKPVSWAVDIDGEEYIVDAAQDMTKAEDTAELVREAEQPEAPIVVKPRRVPILPRKAELLTEIQAAIEKAPATKDATPEQLEQRVTFEIDGGADIINTKEALTQFYERVKSAPEATTWPEPAKKVTIPRPIAAKQEEIGPLHKAPPGYFTDGHLLIKGAPPTKAKKAERPSTLSQEDIDTVLNVETEPAEFQHYAISTGEVKGISQNPILGLKGPSHEYEPDRPLVIFKSQGKYYQYPQNQFSAIRNRFPDATYKIAANGQLVAYDATGEPMAALMPIVGKTGEPAGTIEPPVVLPTPTPGQIDFEDLIADIPNVPRGPEPEHIGKVIVDTFREWPKEIKKVGKDYWIEVMAAAKKLLTPLRYKALRQSMLGAFRVQKEKALGIELQDVRDALSATHELGHNIDWLLNDRTFPRSIKARLPDAEAGEMTLRAELKKISQVLRPDLWRAEPTAFGAKSYATRHTELMADFISHYILDPAKTRELAPNVTEAFEKKLAGKPEFFDVVSRLQESRYEGPEEPPISEHIRETFPLPKEFKPLQLIVDMTDKDYVKAAEELGITAARHYKLLMHRAQLEAERIDKLVPDKARQTDLVVIAENGTANPWTGKTREEILKEKPLTPDERKAINLFRGYQELARQTVNKYLRGADITEYIKFIEDYFVHAYETPLTQKYKTAIARWAKTSPQAKKRILPDLAKAVELGLTPRTKTLSDGLLLWAGMNYRVATNKAFLSILPQINNEDGISILQKPQDKPDWPTVDYWPIRQTYARPLPNRGILLFQGRVAVDPRVKPFIDAMFGRRAFNTPVRILEGFNALAKSFELTLFSLFHHFEEFYSACGALGPRATPFLGGYYGQRAQVFGKKPKLWGLLPAHITTLQAGRQLEQCPEFMEDYLAHGGQKGYISTEGIGLMERMLKTAADYLEHMTQKEPTTLLTGAYAAAYVPVKTIEALYSFHQRLLWDNVQRAKLLNYYDIVADGAKNSDLPIKDVKEIAVKYINDNFGGQEWLNSMFRNPKTRQFFTQLMMSLDWTWSQIKTAKWPFVYGGKTSTEQARRALMRKIGRHHWFWYLAAISGSTIAGSYALSGHGPWENEIGHKLDVDWTNFWRSLPWNWDWKQRGDYARRYARVGKAGRELVRWITSPLRAFGNKLSPAARTMFEQGTGFNIGSEFPEPWVRDDLESYQEVYARFKHLMKNFKPFSLSGNNAFLAMPSVKGMTYWKAVKAYEEIFNANANIACGGLTETLTRLTHALDRDKKRLVMDIIDACDLNHVDWEQAMPEALSNVRSKYYGRFWNAARKQDINQCNRYADALLALQVTEEGFMQSLTVRAGRLSKESAKLGIETFLERERLKKD